MAATIRILSIPQVGDSTRYIALTSSDYEAVGRDRAMLDGIKPLAILDLYDDGRRDWVRRGDSADARNAILESLRNGRWAGGGPVLR